MRGHQRELAARILWGLVIGLVAGVAVLLLGKPWPGLLTGARWLSRDVFDPFGQVFLRLLFFVIVPLVFASLAAGVAQLGSPGRLGPLALRTFALFFANMAIAVGLGFCLMNWLKPGASLGGEAVARLMADQAAVAQKHALAANQATAPLTLGSIVDMFMPKNLLGAIVGDQRGMIGEVLPLILFSILVGAAAMGMSEEKRLRLQGLFETLAELMVKIVDFALRLAPYAVPAMIFSVVMKIGFGVVVTLGLFVVGCLAAMLLHLTLVMSLWLRFFARRSPLEFLRKVRTVLVTAFSTSSSNATLPAALECATRDLGVRPSIAGFVLPLGTTMNMSGTALFEGCTVLFVAQAYGVPLGVGQQLTLLVLAVLSAVAVAGIPGGSLPLIAGLLAGFGIPPEGIGIVIGVDRILDMSRTLVNVGCDMVTTVVVDAWTPTTEKDRLTADFH
jgi:DAACS family dicarboxylate/amino acid:cation (Na+ or H+) symporter